MSKRPHPLASLVGAAVLSGAHAAAQTATPIPPAFFGVSMINAKDAPAVPMGTVAHGDFAWQRVEQQKGVFDFAILDAYVAAAQANGLVDTSTNTASVAITLAAGTPGWAVADKSSCGTSNGIPVCTAPPDDVQDWKDFVTALLRHFDGTARSRTSASTSSGTSSTWRSGGRARTPRWSLSRRPRTRSSTPTRIRSS